MEQGLIVSGVSVPELAELISEHVIKKLDFFKPSIVEAVKDDQVDAYTVREVAVKIRRSEATVARHIRMGLLSASKIGKSWLVHKEEFHRYKYNKHA